MAYVVTAEWRAKPGAEERLAEICDELTESSRSEPGNRFYEAHRSRDGPPALPPLCGIRRRGRLPGPPGLRALHRGSSSARRSPTLLERQAREVFDATSRLIDLSPEEPMRRAARAHAGRHSGSALRAVAAPAVATPPSRSTA